MSILVIKDLAALLCASTTPLRELLARINSSPWLFLLIADDKGRLLGTATDGDVRRALLAGAELSSPAEICMQRSPRVGSPDNWAQNRTKLSEIRSVIPFLPIVDAQGILVEVLVQRNREPVSSAGLVMAGGRGSRLGAHTEKMPKPLLQVGGRPMLDRVLSLIEDVGVSDIFVSVNYLADQVERFCAERSSRAKLHILRETVPAGTAGAIGALPRSITGPVTVMNADVITEVDLRALAAFYSHQGLDACLAAAHHEVEIPFGVVHADATGLLQDIVEKPKLNHYVAAGIYILGPEIRGMVQPGRKIDMPELLNEGRRAGLRIGVFPLHEYWRDVGRPDDLDAVDSHVQSRRV